MCECTDTVHQICQLWIMKLYMKFTCTLVSQSDLTVQYWWTDE